MVLKTRIDKFYDEKLGHCPYCVEIIFANQQTALAARDWGQDEFGPMMWPGNPVTVAENYKDAKWCMTWMDDDKPFRPDIPVERVKIWFIDKEDMMHFVLRWS